jgi:GT2 family glycosyltransferase
VEVPRVSVIIPTQNRHTLLARALESLSAQSYRDFEVIVVNDGGLDVAEVVGRHWGVDVRLVNHEVNRGRSAARNTGIDSAEGELLAFLDDDDRFYPHHLAALVSAFDAVGAGYALYSHAVQVFESEDGTVVDRKVTGAQDFSHGLLLVTNYICAISVLVPTQVVRDLHGFDTDLDVLEDWDLWLSVAARLQWKHVDVPTAEYRVRQGNGNSTTREFFRFHHALQQVYRRHPLPAGSPLEAYRAGMLAGSAQRSEAYGFDASVVVLCAESQEAVLASLTDVVAVMGSTSYEVILLVPQADGWSALMAGLRGDVQLYVVGEMAAHAAWAWARRRAGGRHLLTLNAGEAVDAELVARALSSEAGATTRVGRLPVPA